MRFILYPFFFLLSELSCLYLFLFLWVHESCHYWMGRLFGVNFHSIQFKQNGAAVVMDVLWLKTRTIKKNLIHGMILLAPLTMNILLTIGYISYNHPMIIELLIFQIMLYVLGFFPSSSDWKNFFGICFNLQPQSYSSFEVKKRIVKQNNHCIWIPHMGISNLIPTYLRYRRKYYPIFPIKDS